MKQPLEIKNCDQMTNDEKLDRLTSSAKSAKQSVSEAGEIEFPADFEIEFLTPKQRMKKLILAVPDLIPSETSTAEQRNAEDYQVCTYLF